LNLRLVQQIELLPSVNNLGRIDFLNALEDAAAKFAPRLDSDVAQKGMRHFAEERLDQIQPGAVYRGVYIAERIEITPIAGSVLAFQRTRAKRFDLVESQTDLISRDNTRVIMRVKENLLYLNFPTRRRCGFANHESGENSFVKRCGPPTPQ
jgi:hypothetical protein